MRIFLIGFMGCGKSTFGKKLSAAIGYEFIDLDQQFELINGMSINGFFESHGEEAFREEESRVLKTYPYPQNCVVATGGGLPCFYDHMEWMNSHGLTLYLEMTPAALAKRLEKGKHKRPLIRDLGETELIDFISRRLAERRPYYRRAFLTLEGEGISLARIRSQLFQLFSNN